MPVPAGGAQPGPGFLFGLLRPSSAHITGRLSSQHRVHLPRTQTGCPCQPCLGGPAPGALAHSTSEKAVLCSRLCPAPRPRGPSGRDLSQSGALRGLGAGGRASGSHHPSCRAVAMWAPQALRAGSGTGVRPQTPRQGRAVAPATRGPCAHPAPAGPHHRTRGKPGDGAALAGLPALGCARQPLEPDREQVTISPTRRNGSHRARGCLLLTDQLAEGRGRA